MSKEPEFLDIIEEAYQQAREQAERANDRLEALADMRSRGIARFDAVRRAPTGQEVMATFDSEDEAEAVLARATQEV